MQEIRSSNPSVVNGICDPSKSRARHHRSYFDLFDFYLLFKYKNTFHGFCYIMIDKLEVNPYKLVTTSSFFSNFIQPPVLPGLDLFA